MRILENINLKNELSRSYIDCLYGVLLPLNYFDGPSFMLSGMTGMAFKFVAHKNLIPASTETYSLVDSSWRAVDMLGIHSEIYSGVNNSLTFPLYQENTIRRIKESIIKGNGVLTWAPGLMEFGVIIGYDDEDEVFYYKDRIKQFNQVMLYKNFGKTNAVFWICQVVGNRIHKDIRDIYRDSLEVCVDEWEIPYKANPHTRNEFGSGKKAYEYLINALETQEYHEFGACRIINYNILAKNETYLYINEVKNEFPELNTAAGKYRVLNDIYQKIHEIVPEDYQINRIKSCDIPQLIQYFKQAVKVEEEAVWEVKKYLKEILGNRYIDILDVKKF